jgi:hypothetical protein
MARSNWKRFILPLALLAVLSTGACRIRQTEEGKLPEIDVKTQSGKMPEYDVDAPKVKVGTEKREITVPKVDVSYPDEKKPPQPPQ